MTRVPATEYIESGLLISSQKRLILRIHTLTFYHPLIWFHTPTSLQPDDLSTQPVEVKADSLVATADTARPNHRRARGAKSSACPRNESRRTSVLPYTLLTTQPCRFAHPIARPRMIPRLCMPFALLTTQLVVLGMHGYMPTAARMEPRISRWERHPRAVSRIQ